MTDARAIIDANFNDAARLFAAAAGDADLVRNLARAAERTADHLRQGGKLLIAGNGGSAAEATHFAGELVGPFLNRARAPIAAIPLGFDPSSLTALANDFGFEDVFAKQLAALAAPPDVFWALSTSGNSPNVLAALREAKSLGLQTVLFTNHDGGRARELADIVLHTPRAPTPRVQELHQLYGHCLCEYIEARLASS